MAKKLLIDAKQPEETRVVLLNQNRVEDFDQETSTKIQLYTNSLLTLDNEAGGITVSDSLGAGFDDDAVRIAGFGSLSGDTPALEIATGYFR